MGSSFPYGMCRMCGADPLIQGVSALLMPSFIELVRTLLNVEIKESDKCSQLVCRQCVDIVRNFGSFSSKVKDTQLTIEQFILFENVQQHKSQLKVEDEVAIVTSQSIESSAQRPERSFDEVCATSPVTVAATVSDRPANLTNLENIDCHGSSIQCDEAFCSDDEASRSDDETTRSDDKRPRYSFESGHTPAQPNNQKTKLIASGPQNCVLSNTICNCGVLVKTTFELVFHEHVHANHTCLHCKESIACAAELDHHFHNCFLTQCRIIDVLLCYVKKCVVTLEMLEENSVTQQAIQAAKPPAAIFTGQSKNMANESLLISQSEAFSCKKLQSYVNLKTKTQYVPMTVEQSTHFQKFNVLNENILVPTKRHRLEKERVSQYNDNNHFLTNVQKILALKSKAHTKTRVGPLRASSSSLPAAQTTTTPLTLTTNLIPSMLFNCFKEFTAPTPQPQTVCVVDLSCNSSDDEAMAEKPTQQSEVIEKSKNSSVTPVDTIPMDGKNTQPSARKRPSSSLEIPKIMIVNPTITDSSKVSQSTNRNGLFNRYRQATSTIPIVENSVELTDWQAQSDSPEITNFTVVNCTNSTISDGSNTLSSARRQFVHTRNDLFDHFRQTTGTCSNARNNETNIMVVNCTNSTINDCSTNASSNSRQQMVAPRNDHIDQYLQTTVPTEMDVDHQNASVANGSNSARIDHYHTSLITGKSAETADLQRLCDPSEKNNFVVVNPTDTIVFDGSSATSSACRLNDTPRNSLFNCFRKPTSVSSTTTGKNTDLCEWQISSVSSEMSNTLTDHSSNAANITDGSNRRASNYQNNSTWNDLMERFRQKN